MTAPRDVRWIYVAAFARAATVSLTGVTVAIYLSNAGWSPMAVGLFIGLGLAGASLATIGVSLRGDRWGRRRTLVALSLLTGSGYLALATLTDVTALAVMAFLGMLNGMGRDRGAASALEQAMLPDVVSDSDRTWALAWYNVVIDVGHAAGALAAAAPSLVGSMTELGPGVAHRIAFLTCAGVMMLAVVPYLALSAAMDVRPGTTASRPPTPLDARSKRVVTRLALLFGVDSIGGGFLNSALIAYWFFHTYQMSEASVAMLFFAARVLNAVSHVGAAWLARRIGLLNTMVWTHLPSSVFLMLAPAAPTAAVAAALFLAREALVEMDVPTRQSYVMAIVKPSERTFASGVTNVTRNVAWAVGPSFAGAVMQHMALAGPLIIGGTLKICYDVMLYVSFRHLRPPEEVAGGTPTTADAVETAAPRRAPQS